ncbi:MAG: hypothetical protein WCD47_18825 [Candidatus Sulfotelmatobacter sp.]
MADDMNKQQGGQHGQGQNQQTGQQGQYGQGQKSGQPGQSGQQQKGNIDPNKKNPSQNDEQEERDRQRRAS